MKKRSASLRRILITPERFIPDCGKVKENGTAVRLDHFPVQDREIILQHIREQAPVGKGRVGGALLHYGGDDINYIRSLSLKGTTGSSGQKSSCCTMSSSMPTG